MPTNVPINSFSPTLAEVDAYEVPSFLADRIVKIHNVPKDFAMNIIREAKRMLYLCVVSGEPIAPPDRIDWAWHEMLMFTTFYKDFSTYIGAFIHHVPNPPTDSIEENWGHIQETLGIPRNEAPMYTKTKTNYKKYFGITPDPLYWP